MKRYNADFHFKNMSLEQRKLSVKIIFINVVKASDLKWLSGFFKADFSLILHVLLAMSNHSGRNFKNLNKTLVVCIELESNSFFVILGSFCRELWGLFNDVKIIKITWETMKIT